MASPVYEFPYSSYQPHAIPSFDNDINAILANIAPPSSDLVYNQSPTMTLQCIPQINTGVGNNTMVFQVPEDLPLETILQQLGVNPSTLERSNTRNSYYRSAPQPMEIYLPPSPHRPRRLVCREVSDSEDDDYFRRSSHHRHRRHSNSGLDQSQSPVALHHLLDRVWHKAKQGSENLPSSISAPNLNSQWQAMRNRPPSPPPPRNYSANNVWQAMRNASPPLSPAQQRAVSNVWHRADYASELEANRLSNMFNRMQQPTGDNFQRPPSPQNREAVHDFLAARNVPYGGNMPPPQQNREAVHDFLAARNVPYGGNMTPPQQNREAVHDFLAARNVPYGGNMPPPQQNREAVHDFLAARNVPYGGNMPPPQQNREAVHDFLAARNVPYANNPSNPSVSNVWNRLDYAAHQAPPPMINIPWNRMQPGPRYPNPPFGGPQRGPGSVPAPASFASLLSQAHRQRLPYAGAA